MARRHPMHLHGFNMYVLHEGEGPWDGTIVSRDNPQRRDVVQVRKHGHLVIQFDAADNPGMLAVDPPAGEHVANDTNYHGRRLAVPLPHRVARVGRLLRAVPHQPRPSGTVSAHDAACGCRDVSAVGGVDKHQYPGSDRQRVMNRKRGPGVCGEYIKNRGLYIFLLPF